MQPLRPRRRDDVLDVSPQLVERRFTFTQPVAESKHLVRPFWCQDSDEDFLKRDSQSLGERHGITRLRRV